MIQGLHHITTVAGSLQRNLDFYIRVLDPHLVKSTVHFNNPNVYHLYYSNDKEALSTYRLTIAALGCGVSAEHDRHYFNSFYFREPGGMLFSVATDQPGLAVDEPMEGLGKKLLLPPQFEGRRLATQQHLPQLNVY